MNFETLLSDSRAVAAPHDTHTPHAFTNHAHIHTRRVSFLYTNHTGRHELFEMLLPDSRAVEAHTTSHTTNTPHTYTNQHIHTRPQTYTQACILIHKSYLVAMNLSKCFYLTLVLLQPLGDKLSPQSADVLHYNVCVVKKKQRRRLTTKRVIIRMFANFTGFCARMGG